MNNIRKILVMGLPRSGKTTLCKALSKQLQAVWFDADDVRQNINKDLTFSLDDRIEQSRRMGWLCDKVVEAGHYSIASFVCPTDETRYAFNIDNSFVIYLDTISVKDSPYENTNMIFTKPKIYDFIFKKWSDPSLMAQECVKELHWFSTQSRKLDYSV